MLSVIFLTDIKDGLCRLKKLKICLMSVKYVLIIGYIYHYHQFIRRITHIVNILVSNNKMHNRHTIPLNTMQLDLLDYYQNPLSQRQKQYETVRAIIVEKQSIKSTAHKFGYKLNPSSTSKSHNLCNFNML